MLSYEQPVKGKVATVQAARAKRMSTCVCTSGCKRAFIWPQYTTDSKGKGLILPHSVHTRNWFYNMQGKSTLGVYLLQDLN